MSGFKNVAICLSVENRRSQICPCSACPNDPSWLKFRIPRVWFRSPTPSSTSVRNLVKMLRPRLRAFLSIPRPSSFFQFNKPILNPQHSLPHLQWRVQWSSTITRRIDAKYFSTAAPSEIPEIIPPRSVGYWLLGTAGLVFGIVIVGGLTRLTESGYVLWNSQLTA
jgi:hypothetical protein